MNTWFDLQASQTTICSSTRTLGFVGGCSCFLFILHVFFSPGLEYTKQRITGSVQCRLNTALKITSACLTLFPCSLSMTVLSSSLRVTYPVRGHFSKHPLMKKWITFSQRWDYFLSYLLLIHLDSFVKLKELHKIQYLIIMGGFFLFRPGHPPLCCTNSLYKINKRKCALDVTPGTGEGKRSVKRWEWCRRITYHKLLASWERKVGWNSGEIKWD